MILTRAPSDSETRAPVDSTGILEVAWIIHSRPDVQERLGVVEEPSTSKLRQAAMFPTVLARVDECVNGSKFESRV